MKTGEVSTGYRPIGDGSMPYRIHSDTTISLGRKPDGKTFSLSSNVWENNERFIDNGGDDFNSPYSLKQPIPS